MQMQKCKYSVLVQRHEVREKEFVVEACSECEAEQKAIEAAADTDFNSEGHEVFSEYTVEYAGEADQ